jgi:hypothetical protein
MKPKAATLDTKDIRMDNARLPLTKYVNKFEVEPPGKQPTTNKPKTLEE